MDPSTGYQWLLFFASILAIAIFIAGIIIFNDAKDKASK